MAGQGSGRENAIAVVGAGVVGCAIAHELARRGASVEVLDPRAPGHGATQASAGILAPHIEGHIPSLLALGVSSLALYDAFVQRLRDDGGGDVEYSRAGTLQVALSAVEEARLESLAHELTQAGVAHRLCEAGEIQALEPAVSADARRALLIPSHGHVVAQALVTALVAAARARGVVFQQTPVAGIASSGGRVCVTTGAGHIDGDVVVVTAGAWSPRIPLTVDGRPAASASRTRPSVRPVRGQIVHLTAPAPFATRVMWGPGCYAVPWRDGSVLVGATVEDEGFEERPTAGGVRGLLNAVVGWLPALQSAALTGVRVGLRPATDDELPIIGPSSEAPGVFYATGHFRNGVLLAPLTAALVAGALVDGRAAPEMQMVRPDRFGL